MSRHRLGVEQSAHCLRLCQTEDERRDDVCVHWLAQVAGGVRNTKAAIAYLDLLDGTLGDAWLSADLFRIGASALLDDLLLQREKLSTGRYGSLDYIAKD